MFKRHALLIVQLAEEVWHRKLKSEFYADCYAGSRFQPRWPFNLQARKVTDYLGGLGSGLGHERRHVISACFWDSPGLVSQECSLYGTCQQSMPLQGKWALTICGTALHCLDRLVTIYQIKCGASCLSTRWAEESEHQWRISGFLQ